MPNAATLASASVTFQGALPLPRPLCHTPNQRATLRPAAFQRWGSRTRVSIAGLLFRPAPNERASPAKRFPVGGVGEGESPPFPSPRIRERLPSQG